MCVICVVRLAPLLCLRWESGDSPCYQAALFPHFPPAGSAGRVRRGPDRRAVGAHEKAVRHRPRRQGMWARQGGMGSGRVRVGLGGTGGVRWDKGREGGFFMPRVITGTFFAFSSSLKSSWTNSSRFMFIHLFFHNNLYSVHIAEHHNTNTVSKVQHNSCFEMKRQKRRLSQKLFQNFFIKFTLFFHRPLSIWSYSISCLCVQVKARSAKPEFWDLRSETRKTSSTTTDSANKISHNRLGSSYSRCQVGTAT